MSELIGIVDLGSNSARLVIFQIYRNRSYNLIYEQKEAVRLSEGSSGHGVLQEEAMSRALETLNLFQKACQRFQVQKIIAVATAAIRNAPNGEDFIQRIKKQIGFSFQILSGQKEAYYGYLGIINTLSETDYLQFDLGGGSIELVWVKDRKVKKSISLPFGAVTLTEKFASQDKITNDEREELLEWLRNQWEGLEWLKEAKGLPVIGTGGTARNIAKMDQKRKKYPFYKIHNYRVDDSSIVGLWDDLSKTDMEERKKWPGLSEGRIDLILAGAGIVSSLVDYLHSPCLIASGCGIREGLFFEYYRKRWDKPVVVPNILHHSTRNMMRFYKVNESHTGHMEKLAYQLYDLLKEDMKLSERDWELLQTSIRLHDIGIAINYYNHARHSAYLIENGHLYGLSHEEQVICALMAAWHGNSTKPVRNYYKQFLENHDWKKAQSLGLFLAIIEALDEGETGIIHEIAGKLKDKSGELKLSCLSKPDLELRLVEPLLRDFYKETGIKIHFSYIVLGKGK